MDPTHNYNSSCIFVFSLWTVIVTICTYVLLCTYGLCYFAFTDCVIIIAAALFALHCYSAIFIAARVQNKLIHSYFPTFCGYFPPGVLDDTVPGLEKIMIFNKKSQKSDYFI